MEILELFAFCILDPSQKYRYERLGGFNHPSVECSGSGGGWRVYQLR